MEKVCLTEALVVYHRKFQPEMMISLQHTPIRLDDNLRHRSCPADGIRSGLQHRELAVHVVIHQGVALIGFLKHGVDNDAP